MAVNKIHFRRMVMAIVRESGICRQTVEQVLPVVFDVIRRELVEGEKQWVAIESFGTFAIKEVPEREHLYTYNGKSEMRHLPAKRVLKFSPTKNFKNEVDRRQYDPTRKSFTRHPDDPSIRVRAKFKYKKWNGEISKGKSTFFPQKTSDESPE